MRSSTSRFSFAATEKSVVRSAARMRGPARHVSEAQNEENNDFRTKLALQGRILHFQRLRDLCVGHRAAVVIAR